MDRLPSRLTVVDSVYYQCPNQKTTQADSRFHRTVESREQPYVRHLEATEEWQLLDCGYLANEPISQVLIINNEGMNLQVRPTLEEATETEKKVLEVGHIEMGQVRPGWEICPKESHRGRAIRGQDLHIRCRSGTAEFTVYLFPA